MNDADQDGWANDHDNCPCAYNPEQEDTDFDGYGDSCDVCDYRLVELPMYGSGRIGVARPDISIFDAPNTGPVYTRELGEKHYELTDHLGNVRAVLGDRKLTGTPGAGNYYADVEAYTHQYPFGMPQPGRTWDNSVEYRYGFNGMETDPEVKGESGNHYTTYFRQYDPRVGRWWSRDPVTHPWESPYAAFYNNPISWIDPFGNCPECGDANDFEVGTLVEPGEHGSTANWKVVRDEANDVNVWIELGDGVVVTGMRTTIRPNSNYTADSYKIPMVQSSRNDDGYANIPIPHIYGQNLLNEGINPHSLELRIKSGNVGHLHLHGGFRGQQYSVYYEDEYIGDIRFAFDGVYNYDDLGFQGVQLAGEENRGKLPPPGVKVLVSVENTSEKYPELIEIIADVGFHRHSNRGIPLGDQLAADASGGPGGGLSGVPPLGIPLLRSPKMGGGRVKSSTNTGVHSTRSRSLQLPAPKTLQQEAEDLIPLNGGRNRVTIYRENELIEIDLAGRSHYVKGVGDIQTPHVKISQRNYSAPNQPAYNTKQAEVRPATINDIRMARRFLTSGTP